MRKSRLGENKVLFWVVNVIVFIAFLWLNIKMPLSADDLDYKKIFGTGEPIKTVSDIVQSQINHYQIWGGRSVVHFIDQLFLLYHKGWFNVANTIVYLGFALLIYRYGMMGRKSNAVLVLEYILLWIAIPKPIDTIVWQTSSMNYLWGSFFILLFIFPYYRLCLNRNPKAHGSVARFLMSIAAFLCGILCGWTIEAGGAMLLVSIVLIIGNQIYRKQKVYGWEISGLLGTLVGYALLILAPGNFRRANIVIQMNEQRGFLYEMAYRIARESYYMLLHMWPLFVCMLIMILLLKRNRKWKDTLKLVIEPLLIVGIALIGVYVMTASPAYAERVLVTPIAFTMVALGKLYAILINSINVEKKADYERVTAN